MRRLFLLIAIAFACIAFGCSTGGENPTSPMDVTCRDTQQDGSHMLWGLFQFSADPVARTLETVPLRMAELHLNALPFLEPPALLNLTLENVEFNGNIINADIGLRHPFLGLNEFSGFDVAGVLITDGSVSGFDDPDIIMAGEGDTRLLNPDGYTRWWNPAEFPVNTGTIKGYNDGLLGAPDSFGDYGSTLNAFKYFCDDLGLPDAPLSDVDPEGRGVFSAGQKNVRQYSIEMGTDGLVFNYAVDASWQFPTGTGPWVVPDDFGSNANKPEAWMLSITEIENTLYNDGVENGGGLTLQVDVYDWFKADMNTVKVESAGNFPVTETSTAIGGGAGYSTYEVEIIDATPWNSGEIELFVTVTCEVDGFGGLLPGKPQAAYAFASAEVDDEFPFDPPLEWTQFQHNAAHSGLTSVNGPQTSNVKYTSLMMMGNALSILAGTGDGIYCTFFGSIYANRPLYAVDRNDGSLLWSQDFGGPESSYVKALCIDPDDGYIYAFSSQDGTIHKLDPADGTDVISPAYNYDIGADDYGVLHENGNLYVTTDNDTVKCLDTTDLSQVWTANVDFFSNGSPAIGIDGNIIVYANNMIRCLDADSSTILWNVPVASTQGTPTVTSDGSIIITTASGAVYAITSDGSLKWNTTPISGFGFSITSAAEGPEGDIYAVCDNSYPDWQEHLVRLDPDDGSLIDSSGTAYDMKSSSIPAIGADGTVYVNGSYRIFAFNPDCTLKWQSSVVGGIMGGQSMGTCAIDVNGNLFAASGTHGFICISDE